MSLSAKSLVVFFSLSGASVLAASFSVTTSVFCTAGRIEGVLSSSTANPCRVSGNVPQPPNNFSSKAGPQFARADASSSFDVTGNTVSGQASGSLSASFFADASVMVTFSDQLLTAGPMRQGVVRGIYSPGSFTANGGNTSYDLTFPGKMYEVFGPSAPPQNVTLGVLFVLSGFIRAGSGGDEELVNSPVVSTYFSLGYFELDGVTPVEISEVPEPNFVWISLLLMAALLRYKLLNTASLFK